MARKLETIKYKNYALPMIGRVWIFPEVIYTRDLEGDLGISFAELDRLQHAVANAICGEDKRLKCIELCFLMSMTRLTSKDIAKAINCNISAIQNWRIKEKVPLLESLVLKELFWIKLFGSKVKSLHVNFGKERLVEMAKTAIDKKLVTPVLRKTGPVTKKAA